ncbi:MAG: hypothetical protein SFY67_00040 [Candidatus Melainabacteria bacterium]|nr:hypothetical protein [Candidatus Melainabacteria bacterium]
MKMARVNTRKILAVTLALALNALVQPASVRSAESDDVGYYGSVLATRKASSAAEHMKKGEYGEAQSDFRQLIGMMPKQEDFYVGLFKASYKMKQWDQCALALEELCNLNPTYKDKLILERGETFYYLNRYTEAEPLLKAALAKVAEPSFIEEKFRFLMTKSIIEHQKIAGKIIIGKDKEKIKAEKYKETNAAEFHENTSRAGLNLENAYLKSEAVFIAEYKGYEKRPDITYYQPPLAKFYIEKFYKGPPLNRNIPIKFEFNEGLENQKRPEGWKFSEELMPKPGSKWIIFVENAVPVDHMFETFHGSYGRQPYSDETLDEVLAILEKHKGQSR